MTNLEIIKKLKEAIFVDEDEYEYQLDFQDGMSNSDIEHLKSQFPNKTISTEIIEILKFTKGWDGYGLDMINFGSIGQFGLWELSSNSLTLRQDGYGNNWILDLDKNGKLGKVYYACHDPAVFVIHSQSLNEYLNDLLEFYKNPVKCHLNEIHDQTVMIIWDKNILCIYKTEFENKNPEFKTYLSKLNGENWTISDLRNGQNKDGFAWGKFGPNQQIERHPTELIWIIKNIEKGFLSRLFGK